MEGSKKNINDSIVDEGNQKLTDNTGRSYTKAEALAKKLWQQAFTGDLKSAKYIQEQEALHKKYKTKEKEIIKKPKGRPPGSRDFIVIYNELQDLKNEEAGEVRRSVLDIVQELEDIAFNREHPDQFKAISTMLDRMLGKPKTQIEIEHGGNLTNNNLIIDVNEDNLALLERLTEKMKNKNVIEDTKDIIEAELIKDVDINTE